MREVLTLPQNQKDIKCTLYNIAFSTNGGIFTIDDILSTVESYRLPITREYIQQIVFYWLENGLIYDNCNEYIINYDLFETIDIY